MDFEGKAIAALSKNQNSIFYGKDYSIVATTMTSTLDLETLKPFLKSLIVFVNPKSGGQKGRIVFEKLKTYLNEENIFDLSKEAPRIGLEKHKMQHDLKVVVCGGDGSLNWVLAEMDSVSFEYQPSVAIIPLGTGNDLSNILGWGTEYKNESIIKFFDKVRFSRIEKLDRWKITTTPINTNTENSLNLEKNFQVRNKLPINEINNYFSIGIDAKIALDSHEARERNPEKFTSPNYNKVVYSKCDGINLLDKIKKLNLHSILILNITSYASGTNPWKKDDKKFSSQSFSDGKFEVIGFKKTTDLLFLQLGIKGIPIAQASKIRISTECPLPMQVDGEPILLQASDILVEKKNQVSMLVSRNVEIKN